MIWTTSCETCETCSADALEYVNIDTDNGIEMFVRSVAHQDVSCLHVFSHPLPFSRSCHLLIWYNYWYSNYRRPKLMSSHFPSSLPCWVYFWCVCIFVSWIVEPFEENELLWLSSFTYSLECSSKEFRQPAIHSSRVSQVGSTPLLLDLSVHLNFTPSLKLISSTNNVLLSLVHALNVHHTFSGLFDLASGFPSHIYFRCIILIHFIHFIHLPAPVHMRIRPQQTTCMVDFNGRPIWYKSI